MVRVSTRDEEEKKSPLRFHLLLPSRGDQVFTTNFRARFFLCTVSRAFTVPLTTKRSHKYRPTLVFSLRS